MDLNLSIMDKSTGPIADHVILARHLDPALAHHAI
jgi:hypothetical protein